ncbi:tetratricopeptide repeat protein [Congregibacter variabilis]|uniref:Tetratricopeptide repeat protein n=1 Tax=Congregibacter variabilis TaxID=3081200 RepID=A0ABZ0I0R8_9GAMM|nr:tetratricopeptide repeat protein [Congregibacter sp. IMCC43200]
MKRWILCFFLSALLSPALFASREIVVGISEKTFKALEEAQVFIDAEDYLAAQEVLAKLRERKLSSYEEAHALNLISYIWYEQGDLTRANDSYLEALALDELPDSMMVTLLLSVAQINLADERYADAEQHLLNLMTFADETKASNQVLLAAALMGQKRYEDALSPLEAAINSSLETENKPQENWLSMLASVHYERNDYVAMRETMSMMVELYPREQHIMNLAALHGQLGEQGRQLALIEALLDDGRLHRPSNLNLIANLYLGEELPYKAADLLEREMAAGRMERNLNNLELLSQAWLLSLEYERAIEPLSEAAKLSESGELYLRLARLHMDAYRFEAAEEAASEALQKGSLRQEGHAWLLRGMAAVQLKNYSGARKRFEKAASFEETDKYANQWLRYVDNEVLLKTSNNGALSAPSAPLE